MADYSRPTDYRFEAMQAARHQYEQWQTWESIVNDGWSDADANADWIICIWCAGVFFQPIKSLHRTECRTSREARVPHPVAQDIIREYELDTPWKDRQLKNKKLYAW